MKKRLSRIKVAVALVLTAGVLIVTTALHNGSAVEMIAVKRGDFISAIVATGTVEGMREVQIGSETNGKIRSIAVKEGSYVKKGDVIIHLDDTKLKAQLKDAEARLNYARLDLQRKTELYKEGAIAKNTLDDTQAKHDVAEAAVDLAKSRLEDTIIAAPITGIVIEKNVEIGEMVYANPATNKSASLVTLADISKVIIRAKVDEENIAKIAAGQPADVLIDAMPGKVFQGSVAQLLSKANKESKTVDVKILINGSLPVFKSGMTVDVSIIAERKEKALFIPKQALVEREGKQQVFVVKDGTAQLRAVKTGFSNKGQVEILDGLDENELIVVNGQGELKNGSTVAPKKSS